MAAQLVDEQQEWKAILVERVKTLQKSSTEAKQRWWTYCKKRGSSDYDPKLKDLKFLTAFLDAEAAFAAERPSEYGAEKARLIQRIKDFQRSSAENKQAWYAFCTRYGGTNFDPARHDEAFLKKFCDALDASNARTSAQLGSSSSASALCRNGPSDMDSGHWDGSSGWDADAGGWSKGDGKGSWSVWDAWGCESWGEPTKAAGKGSLCTGVGANSGLSNDRWGGSMGSTSGEPGSAQNSMVCAMMAWKGKAMAAAAAMMGKGASNSSTHGSSPSKGMPPVGARLVPGTGAMGAGAKSTFMKPSQTVTTMGEGKGKSEFGILDAPPAALLNKKRGMLSASTAPVVMDEEQAKLFQQSLKKQRV